LLVLTGFQVTKRIKTDIGNTSLFIGLFMYPFFVLFTLLAYILYRKKNTHVEQAAKQQILWERVKLNISPTTLFCKHIFWECVKKEDLGEVIAKLKKMKR